MLEWRDSDLWPDGQTYDVYLVDKLIARVWPNGPGWQNTWTYRILASHSFAESLDAVREKIEHRYRDKPNPDDWFDLTNEKPRSQRKS